MPAVSAPTFSDEALMAQVQAGDLDQLTGLFERYHGPLFGFLARLANGDRDLAQDLTQNVFVRVLRYRASYQPGQAFRAWVYQLARHVWADHYQRQRPGADLEEVEKTAAHGRAAQAQRAATDQHQALHEALALLPAAQGAGAAPLPGLRLRRNRRAAGLHRRRRPRQSPPRAGCAA